MAILSAYVSQPVPTDIAFTGALNVHVAQTRELGGVSGVSEKLFAALRSGIRKVYLPLQNEADLSLAVRKAAEGTLIIRPVRSVDVACHDLIYKPKEQGFRTILKEMLRNFFLFFVPRNKAAESLAHKYSGHVLLSSALLASMYQRALDESQAISEILTSARESLSEFPLPLYWAGGKEILC